MKLTRSLCVLSAVTALGLGVAAEACATAGTTGGVDAGFSGGGTNCATLSACCMTLSAGNAAQCTPVVTMANDSECASFLTMVQQNGFCAASSSGSGSSTSTSTSNAGSISSSLTSSSSTSSVGDAGVDAGSGAGSDAGTGSGSSSSVSSSSGTGSGSGSGGVPTTCAEAYGTVGCCGSPGTEYYCAAGSTTVTKLTCTAGKVCTWDSAQSYYDCLTGTVSKADPSGRNPIACQ